VPRITTFCICIYALGCRLSLFKLCDSDFGIIPVAEIAIGTACTASCFHITRISFASSWYFFVIIIIIIIIIITFERGLISRHGVNQASYDK
jgi:hypothetical protein